MLRSYFARLYERTMREAYTTARKAAADALREGGNCLDCGATEGHEFDHLQAAVGMSPDRYTGIEWHPDVARAGQAKGRNIVQGDLNHPMNFPDESFDCVFGYSVLEHLLNPCAYLRESFRCLRPGGTLIILTPNISTFFTVALLLIGKMPSSGPHPDSDALLQQEETFRVHGDDREHDPEADTPLHRHLVVFSYRVLKSYLQLLGLEQIQGHGFGLYPFPNFMQKPLEAVDPWHCHQMVFVARKPL
jgi:SAM-dependent methyltransferase